MHNSNFFNFCIKIIIFDQKKNKKQLKKKELSKKFVSVHHVTWNTDKKKVQKVKEDWKLKLKLTKKKKDLKMAHTSIKVFTSRYYTSNWQAIDYWLFFFYLKKRLKTN